MTNEALLGRIEINPKVMVGKPIIKGTRLTVVYILNLMASGAKIEEILEECQLPSHKWPSLKFGQINQKKVGANIENRVILESTASPLAKSTTSLCKMNIKYRDEA